MTVEPSRVLALKIAAFVGMTQPPNLPVIQSSPASNDRITSS